MTVQVLQGIVWLTALADKPPKANNVVAGWVGAVVIVGLLVAVALLAWSLTRHLKKVQRNEERGDVFDPSDKKPRRTSI